MKRVMIPILITIIMFYILVPHRDSEPAAETAIPGENMSKF
jgi:hypothetical protein